MLNIISFESYLEKGNELIHMKKWKESIKSEMHVHDFLEIEYVLSGKGIHKVENTIFETKAGDFYFVNVGTSHCFSSISEEDSIVVLNCIFSPKLLYYAGISYDRFSEVVNDTLYNYLFPDEIRMESYFHVYDKNLNFRHSIECMYSEYVEKKEGYLNVMFGILIEIVVCAMREYKIQKSSDHSLNIRRQYINNVLIYIEEHCSKDISLCDLSKIALLSPNYLSSIFKEITGKTISEHIQKSRIKNVCKMLSETNKPFLDIAYENGYSSDNFLRKVFIKEMGITPSEYRKNTKK